MKNNYTLPTLRCLVIVVANNSQTKVSTKVTQQDGINCSLTMPRSVVGIRCLLNHSSALLEVAVSCDDEHPRITQLFYAIIGF